MAEWRHRLMGGIDRNKNTAVCVICGVTKIVWRKEKTLKYQTPRCYNSLMESKDREVEREIKKKWAGLGRITVTIDEPRG